MKYSNTFPQELIAAGIAGLPFVWLEDGSFRFEESITPEQRAIIEKVAAANLAAPPKPLVLTASQYKFQKALLRTPEGDSNLLDIVEAVVAASTDRELKLAWLKAGDYRSDDPEFLKMATALGKTEAEWRAVFELANTL